MNVFAEDENGDVFEHKPYRKRSNVSKFVRLWSVHRQGRVDERVAAQYRALTEKRRGCAYRGISVKRTKL